MGLSWLGEDVSRCSFPNCVVQRNRERQYQQSDAHDPYLIPTVSNNDDTVQMMQLHCFRAKDTR